MNKAGLKIGMVESSALLCEGIQALLHRSELNCWLYFFNDLDALSTTLLRENLNIVILNPLQLINRQKQFRNLKKLYPGLAIVGMVYNFIPKDILDLLDDSFNIDDSQESIVQLLLRQNSQPEGDVPVIQTEVLSDRETDVLIQLVSGFSNKEIADNLNISIHTVISHRKNISQKTGIKSQSGLTIYAITKKIVDLEAFRK